MNLLLDTHTFVWWVEKNPKLSTEQVTRLQEVERKGDKFNISIITLWEIARLVSLGRLEISTSIDHWFDQLEEDSRLSILPLSGSIVLESMRLGRNFPKDPADQLIAATARIHGLKLMTVDQEIIKSGVVAIA